MDDTGGLRDERSLDPEDWDALGALGHRAVDDMIHYRRTVAERPAWQPLPDAAMDGLISSHVLEHIADDRAALAELARVVRPGGWAIVMVPYDPKMPVTPEDPAIDTPAKRMAAYGHPFHHRYYGADLVHRLAEAGFDAEMHDTRHLLSPHQRRRFRLNRTHLFHCRRL